MSTSTLSDIIIGTGPGGGTLVYKLAPSGEEILEAELEAKGRSNGIDEGESRG
jgi:hypothetical protein